MSVPPYVFKSQAVRALKGNWQTALLVSFAASLPLTVVQVLRSTQLPDLAVLGTYGAALAALRAVRPVTWFLLGAAGAVAAALTPALAVGCNHYFIRRLRKEELGFAGLFSRMDVFGKAFLLHLLIGVKIFLWSLLLVVPGILALLRYSLAPFYLAEKPELGVMEALELSKQTMKDKKGSYLLLQLSFVGWLLASMLCQILLYDVSPILALVASMFIQLFMATYLNAACAGFYLAAVAPDGMRSAQADAAAWLNAMSGGRRFFGGSDGDRNDGDETPENGDADRNGETGETGDGDAAEPKDKDRG